MLRRSNDYSFFDDKVFNQIAAAVNDQAAVVHITQNKKQAVKTAKLLCNKGYESSVEQKNDDFYIYAKPQQKVLLKEAEMSGQFTQLADNRYSFSHQANNPLGIQHYDSDDGTIWKIMTDKNGKEYLVKEVDDNNVDKVIRQPSEPGFRSTVLASLSSTEDPKQLENLCKAVYTKDELVHDLIKHASKIIKPLLHQKLNIIIDEQLKALNVTSMKTKQAVKEKIASAIDNNAIYTRQQINDLINKFSDI